LWYGTTYIKNLRLKFKCIFVQQSLKKYLKTDVVKWTGWLGEYRLVWDCYESIDWFGIVFFQNMVAKFFLMNYLLHDILLRYVGQVFLDVFSA